MMSPVEDGGGDKRNNVVYVKKDDVCWMFKNFSLHQKPKTTNF